MTPRGASSFRRTASTGVKRPEVYVFTCFAYIRKTTQQMQRRLSVPELRRTQNRWCSTLPCRSLYTGKRPDDAISVVQKVVDWSHPMYVTSLSLQTLILTQGRHKRRMKYWRPCFRGPKKWRRTIQVASSILRGTGPKTQRPSWKRDQAEPEELQDAVWIKRALR